MKNEKKDHLELEQAKINLETAKVPWTELQRFFAAGQVFEIATDQDLTEVAMKMSQDDSGFVQDLISESKVSRVSDERAAEWVDEDALVWCVVVKPYILVQGIKRA